MPYAEPTPPAGATPPLIGREREATILRDHLGATFAGRGCLVLISGEAGIGKSSLALAAARHAQAQGAAFGLGRSDERSGAPPFAPWRELLDELRTAVGALDPATLPPPFGDGPPAPSAYELLRATTDWLRTAAASRPLVLLLDDLHWADRDTLELLRFATRDLARVPLAMLATYREEEVERGQPLFDVLPQLQRDRPVTTVRLAALGTDDIARLVESSHGPCSPELAAYLRARADGNPFYAVELLRDLVERRLLARDAAGRWQPPSGSVDAPVLLQQIIGQRLARLSGDVEALLEVAATVGAEWDLPVAEAVLDWPEDRLLPALEAALAARLAVATDRSAERYRFAHALIRETLAGRPVARRRKRLHARIGEVLEGFSAGGTLDALAYHFGEAEDWGRAARYALAAGDEARERYATHGALRLYQRASDALRRVPDAAPRELTIALPERLGQIQIVLNRQEQAEAAYEQMRHAARAVADRPAEVRALAALSVVRARLNRLGEAQVTGDAALQLALGLDDPWLLAVAHGAVGHVHEVIGELEPGRRHVETSEALARAGGHRDVLGQCLRDLAIMAIWRGDYALATTLADEAMELARAARDAPAFVGACMRLGLAHGERGEFEAARGVLHLGMEQATESGERRNLAKLLNTLGWLHSELGDLAAARHWDERALEAARQAPDVWGVSEAECYALLNLATDGLLAGDPAAAAARLDEVAPLLDRSQYTRFRFLNRYYLVRAELALDRADHDAAAQWADEAHALAAAKGLRKNAAKARLLQGRALSGRGRAREAVAPLRQAVALVDELGHVSLGWQTRRWLGQALADVRRPDEAADLYRQARERVATIAAGLNDEHWRACFLGSTPVRELGEASAQPEARAPHPAHAAGLSDREVEVLRLIAQGATNAAIARALGISARTVDVHVTSILTKTGGANRTAAAAFALRHGLN